MQMNILEGRAGYVLMGRVSVTISYSFRCLTTETVKYTSFIKSCPVCKNVNMFVSVNCSVQRKSSNGNLVFIFSCV